jgi:hypothetical protein
MNRADVAHDHLALEHALRTIRDRFETLTCDGRDVIDVLDDVVTLMKAMKGHHEEEETQLFAFAARRHGSDAELTGLIAQHRQLERELQEVADLVNYETDIVGAKRALCTFAESFDRHTLREADYFATRWDELFPGEVMAG